VKSGWKMLTSGPPAMTREAATAGRGPGGIEVGKAELGCVPGHAGVVPLDPSEAVSAGVPRRLHVEVAALSEAAGPLAAFGVDDGDAVDVFEGVNVGDPAAIRRDGRARGGAEGRGDGAGRAPGEVLPVDALVGLADEEGSAAARVTSPPP
jgi:hypothetical protein